MRKTILYLVSEDWYFLSHRLQLALGAKKRGYEVKLICRNNGMFSDIERYGIECFNINWSRKILSPFAFIKNLIHLKKIITHIRPSTIHFISLMPILVGMTSIFFNNNFKAVLTLTGLGTIFIKNSLKILITRFLIKCLLIVIFKKNNITVIVQNKDDEEFCKNELHCSDNKIYLIRGSGVDIKFHSFLEQPKYPPVIFSFVGRLLEDKGFKILIDAFNLALKKDNKIQLLVAGSIDKYNPSAVSGDYLSKITYNKNIKWLKEVKDIREIWKKSHVAVLPSRREGLPMSLLEAAANGRAIITTDVPGCREIAIDKHNAILVPRDDIKILSEAILFLASNHNIRKNYGLNSRKIVENDMSLDKVIDKTISLYSI